MKFMLGTKQHMTQVFDDKGIVHPVTVLKTAPLTVTKIKTKDGNDGYSAVQVGFGIRRTKNVNNAVIGQVTKALAGTDKLPAENKTFAVIKEFERTTGDMNVGDMIDVSAFKEGDTVIVSAISKGKGFQGVVKRHGFHGGPRSHGQKHSEREPGSIGGAGRDGGRVAKGKRMAGRMGGERITVKGLTVVKIVPETGEMMIRGAIPGRRGTVVEVRGK